MSHSIADWVIGQYIGSTLFCLLVLRTIRDEDSGAEFIPHVGTALGVVLGLISMWLLIWFIHHVATSIQAPNLVDELGKELQDTLGRFFPERVGEASTHENQLDPTTIPDSLLNYMENPLIFLPPDRVTSRG
ncbi:MAG: DUF2254 family protein [Planctomycetaceae bacterium]